MRGEEVLDHLLALVAFYREKMKTDELSGSEAGVYLKALCLLGARDVAIRSRHVERLETTEGVLDLPFETES
jgi:hypothetical protein